MFCHDYPANPLIQYPDSYRDTVQTYRPLVKYIPHTGIFRLALFYYEITWSYGLGGKIPEANTQISYERSNYR